MTHGVLFVKQDEWMQNELWTEQEAAEQNKRLPIEITCDFI